MKTSIIPTLTLIYLLAGIAGCDPDNKKKCEWFLVPDQDRIGKVNKGMIPLCARNFAVNKQDCRLQASLEFAEAHYQKKFKYSDMKVDGTGIPRTVQEIKHCK